MLPVPGHKLRRQETEFCEQPCQNRNFERDSHHQAQHVQRINIRTEQNGIFHFLTHLIGRKKAECEREYQEIAEQYSRQEEQITPEYQPAGIFLFILVECRRNKMKKLIVWLIIVASAAPATSNLNVNINSGSSAIFIILPVIMPIIEYNALP